MSGPVVAIGLDAADPGLVEGWMEKGHLPVLSRLREAGSYGRLQTFRTYRAETPWTTFLTGCEREQTGFWTQLRVDPDYQVRKIEAYDFEAFRPFYALGASRRVSVFDVPHARLCDDAEGLQITAWGAHSPQAPSESSPPELFREIIENYGPHPLLNNDNANIYDVRSLNRLLDGMLQGIRQRQDISCDLLARAETDLFVTVFGDPHVVGHYFWHFTDPTHPLHDAMAGRYDVDPQLQVFQAIDAAIGRIAEAAGDGASVVVFAAHGMGANVMDLPSMVYLPEILLRDSFPGRQAIGPARAGAPVPPIIDPELVEERGWASLLWGGTRESSWLRSLAKRHLRDPWLRRADRLLPPPRPQDLHGPRSLRAAGAPEPFQPATWSQHLWPQMRAFALPSFSEGYVRINLRGREAQGIVPSEEYGAECDRVCDLLQGVKNARNGRPIAQEIIRTREAPGSDTNGPDADLVVLWDEDQVADVVESPDIGRIGPVPFMRSGSHRAHGFLMGAGPEIASGSLPADAHSLDIAPTLLGLLGVEPPGHMKGRRLLR